MSPHRLAFVALCGTVVLATGLAAGLLDIRSLKYRRLTDAGPQASSPAGGAEPSQAPQPTKIEQQAIFSDAVMLDAGIPQPPSIAPPEPVAAEVASAGTPDPPQVEFKEPPVSPLETLDECLVPQICIDRYLWAVYQRAPKIDTIKVLGRIKVTTKKKGKTRTAVKTVVRLVDEDFTWKDPKAAQRAGMSLQDYVIGGMDPKFKQKLYGALRAMEDAGLAPGMTSGFRDNYRQALASGHKAAVDSSYHGGSRRGGYGHGLAADLVSVKGTTRGQRWLASESMWKWIDAHGQEFGIGRPYLDRDPPHVGPIDGKEYAEKRGHTNSQHAAANNSVHQVAVRHDHSKARRAITASPKLKSI